MACMRATRRARPCSFFGRTLVVQRTTNPKCMLCAIMLQQVI
jgi:hypothetical protein